VTDLSCELRHNTPLSIIDMVAGGVIKTSTRCVWWEMLV